MKSSFTYRKRVVPEVKRYKFQALVTLYPPGNGGLPAELPGPSRRLVVRGQHRETHGSKIFSALVANSGESVLRPGEEHVRVTMVLAGDDVLEYFAPGDRFALWLGSDIGRGVVTRRVFI